MGWEKRGNGSYYYRKERDGSSVKSVYVGKGDTAHLIAQFQSSSETLERLARAENLINDQESEKADTYLEQSLELIKLFTEALLHSVGFHTHHRQWRRKRKCH